MKAEIIIHKNFEIGKVDPRLYGSFIEHLGRAVYSGIYEPGHETSDDQGFRRDVLELIRQIDVPVVRYPGGNFVSGYNWEDGTGDRAKRPQRPELAWGTIETNEFGLDEFQEWAKRAHTEPMMAINLGTRGMDEARNLLEYCNLDTDTYYANMRRENGFEKPFGIKLWCLGNEMDGPWQMGYKTAEEYGRLASQTAKIMRMIDPNIELVVCGSSSLNMSTFGSWEMTVLEHTYDDVDYISLHTYYNNRNNDTAAFLGNSDQMDRFIEGVVAICDAIKAKKRSKKTIHLSFDEWNVWFHSNGAKFDKWQIAPPQLEDIYTFEDALVVGGMLITLQNHCDRVKIACLAQLVNVIAPIMAEKGGRVWAQTIFYPYMYASQNGRGTVLRALVKSDGYATSYADHVPYLTTSVVHNEEKREIVVFAVNRSLEEDMETTLALEGFPTATPVSHVYLYSDDLKAVNDPDAQRVAPETQEVSALVGEHQQVTLKKHSWNMITYRY